jgi:hypothetical protein
MTLNRIALATLLAAGSGLMAQDARFGLQAQIAVPQGDLKDAVDSKLGLGAGVHGTFAFDQHAIRPRFDYTFYPEADLSGVKTKVSSMALGADYLYFVDGKDQGVYFTAGLSAIRWKVEVNTPFFSDSTTKLGVAAGLGYQWTKAFGTEVRYVNSSIDPNFTANNIVVGATFRF